MKTDKFVTVYESHNFKYEITAYRPLTNFECKGIVYEYLKLPGHEIPEEGKTIKINTEIR